ncbi:hypothetical protein ACIP66_26190 [Pseudomonas sp. NPDC088429]|uniref:hypothetical protein n=1 Tax=Pseudomonas sp. NPDC088429 TaxID=3364455 RepID=UPI00382E250A
MNTRFFDCRRFIARILQERKVPRLLLLLVFLACTSCAMNHGKPIAKITYSGVERYQDTRIYQVSFKSDVDVLDLFKSRISQTLLCSLNGDTDFSVAHRIDQYAEGMIERKSSANEFKADLLFSQVKDASSDSVMSSDQMKAVLQQKKTIVCKVRVNAYSYKTYFSESMEIPSADLLREVGNY